MTVFKCLWITIFQVSFVIRFLQSIYKAPKIDFIYIDIDILIFKRVYAKQNNPNYSVVCLQHTNIYYQGLIGNKLDSKTWEWKSNVNILEPIQTLLSYTVEILFNTFCFKMNQGFVFQKYWFISFSSMYHLPVMLQCYIWYIRWIRL